MTVPDVRSRRRFWIGVLLLVGGLLGHLFAARAIGGSYVAYRDHIFGFVLLDRKSTRLNSSHVSISYAVFCLKKKKNKKKSRLTKTQQIMYSHYLSPLPLLP